MMLFHLLKKDFLIVKKYVLIMMAAAIVIPVFMRWRAPEYTGTLGFAISVIFAVLMPLQYKLGYDRTKFAFTVIIMASPFILPQLLKMESLRFCFVSVYSPALVCGAGALAGFGILAVSVFVSVKFYENTDLA